MMNLVVRVWMYLFFVYVNILSKMFLFRFGMFMVKVLYWSLIKEGFLVELK